ncbi:MAG: nuclear transport factor 2 family protein [Gemmatimonadota bacterium]
MKRSILGLAVALACASSAEAQSSAADSASAVHAVEQYHAALAAGDSVVAVSLLADDVLILESGAIETRSAYLGHHLGADMQASKNSKGTRVIQSVRLAGDVAWVVAKTTNPPSGAQGSTGSEMAELMVLSRTPTGWKIRAVHWSSRRLRS